jgi:hypothetical protein
VVYYKQNAYNDLDQIFSGLIMWSEHTLTVEHATQYIADIEEICNHLDVKLYHRQASYEFHKKHGDYIHQYKRNPKTSWYIIYNRDLFNNVFIERIISNYMTIF